VVLGAHPEDYKAVAPPNSYIHVEDFKSIKDLAEYLTLLDNNDVLYNEYFEYKQVGEVIHVWEQFFCRLCSILYYGDIIPGHNWGEGSSWESVDKCLKKKKWFWNTM
jgi:glycoprotein 3-alpha-L-fucosyltransferase